MSRKFQELGLKEANRLRDLSETYLEPLAPVAVDDAAKDREMSDFAFDFKRNWSKKEGERAQLLKDFPDSLARYYTKFVLETNTVLEKDFWHRYLFRCDQDRIVRELQRQDAAHVREKLILGGGGGGGGKGPTTVGGLRKTDAKAEDKTPHSSAQSPIPNSKGTVSLTPTGKGKRQWGSGAGDRLVVVSPVISPRRDVPKLSLGDETSSPAGGINALPLAGEEPSNGDVAGDGSGVDVKSKLKDWTAQKRESLIPMKKEVVPPVGLGVKDRLKQWGATPAPGDDDVDKPHPIQPRKEGPPSTPAPAPVPAPKTSTKSATSEPVATEEVEAAESSTGANTNVPSVGMGLKDRVKAWGAATATSEPEPIKSKEIVLGTDTTKTEVKTTKKPQEPKTGEATPKKESTPTTTTPSSAPPTPQVDTGDSVKDRLKKWGAKGAQPAETTVASAPATAPKSTPTKASTPAPTKASTPAAPTPTKTATAPLPIIVKVELAKKPEVEPPKSNPTPKRTPKWGRPKSVGGGDDDSVVSALSYPPERSAPAPGGQGATAKTPPPINSSSTAALSKKQKETAIAKKESDRLRTIKETYTAVLLKHGYDDPDEQREVSDFVYSLARTWKSNEEFREKELRKYPESMAMFYKALVLTKQTVTDREFWERYLYRCDDERILRFMRRDQRKAAYDKNIRVQSRLIYDEMGEIIGVADDSVAEAAIKERLEEDKPKQKVVKPQEIKTGESVGERMQRLQTKEEHIPSVVKVNEIKTGESLGERVHRLQTKEEHVPSVVKADEIKTGESVGERMARLQKKDESVQAVVKPGVIVTGESVQERMERLGTKEAVPPVVKAEEIRTGESVQARMGRLSIISSQAGGPKASAPSTKSYMFQEQINIQESKKVEEEEEAEMEEMSSSPAEEEARSAEKASVTEEVKVEGEPASVAEEPVAEDVDSESSGGDFEAYAVETSPSSEQQDGGAANHEVEQEVVVDRADEAPVVTEERPDAGEKADDSRDGGIAVEPVDGTAQSEPEPDDSLGEADDEGAIVEGAVAHDAACEPTGGDFEPTVESSTEPECDPAAADETAVAAAGVPDSSAEDGLEVDHPIVKGPAVAEERPSDDEEIDGSGDGSGPVDGAALAEPELQSSSGAETEQVETDEATAPATEDNEEHLAVEDPKDAKPVEVEEGLDISKPEVDAYSDDAEEGSPVDEKTIAGGPQDDKDSELVSDDVLVVEREVVAGTAEDTEENLSDSLKEGDVVPVTEPSDATEADEPAAAAGGANSNAGILVEMAASEDHTDEEAIVQQEASEDAPQSEEESSSEVSPKGKPSTTPEVGHSDDAQTGCGEEAVNHMVSEAEADPESCASADGLESTGDVEDEREGEHEPIPAGSSDDSAVKGEQSSEPVSVVAASDDFEPSEEIAASPVSAADGGSYEDAKPETDETPPIEPGSGSSDSGSAKETEERTGEGDGDAKEAGQDVVDEVLKPKGEDGTKTATGESDEGQVANLQAVDAVTTSITKTDVESPGEVGEGQTPSDKEEPNESEALPPGDEETSLPLKEEKSWSLDLAPPDDEKKKKKKRGVRAFFGKKDRKNSSSSHEESGDDRSTASGPGEEPVEGELSGAEDDSGFDKTTVGDDSGDATHSKGEIDDDGEGKQKKSKKKSFIGSLGEKLGGKKGKSKKKGTADGAKSDDEIDVVENQAAESAVNDDVDKANPIASAEADDDDMDKTDRSASVEAEGVDIEKDEESSKAEKEVTGEDSEDADRSEVDDGSVKAPDAGAAAEGEEFVAVKPKKTRSGPIKAVKKLMGRKREKKNENANTGTDPNVGDGSADKNVDSSEGDDEPRRDEGNVDESEIGGEAHKANEASEEVAEIAPVSGNDGTDDKDEVHDMADDSKSTDGDGDGAAEGDADKKKKKKKSIFPAIGRGFGGKKDTKKKKDAARSDKEGSEPVVGDDVASAGTEKAVPITSGADEAEAQVALKSGEWDTDDEDEVDDKADDQNSTDGDTADKGDAEAKKKKNKKKSIFPAIGKAFGGRKDGKQKRDVSDDTRSDKEGSESVVGDDVASAGTEKAVPIASGDGDGAEAKVAPKSGEEGTNDEDEAHDKADDQKSTDGDDVDEGDADTKKKKKKLIFPAIGKAFGGKKDIKLKKDANYEARSDKEGSESVVGDDVASAGTEKAVPIASGDGDDPDADVAPRSGEEDADDEDDKADDQKSTDGGEVDEGDADAKKKKKKKKSIFPAIGKAFGGKKETRQKRDENDDTKEGSESIVGDDVASEKAGEVDTSVAGAEVAARRVADDVDEGGDNAPVDESAATSEKVESKEIDDSSAHTKKKKSGKGLASIGNMFVGKKAKNKKDEQSDTKTDDGIEGDLQREGDGNLDAIESKDGVKMEATDVVAGDAEDAQAEGGSAAADAAADESAHDEAGEDDRSITSEKDAKKKSKKTGPLNALKNLMGTKRKDAGLSDSPNDAGFIIVGDGTSDAEGGTKEIVAESEHGSEEVGATDATIQSEDKGDADGISVPAMEEIKDEDGVKMKKKSSKSLGAIGKIFGGKKKDKNRDSDIPQADDASEAGGADEGETAEGGASKEETDDHISDKKKKKSKFRSRSRSKSPKRESGKGPINTVKNLMERKKKPVDAGHSDSQNDTGGSEAGSELGDRTGDVDATAEGGAKQIVTESETGTGEGGAGEAIDQSNDDCAADGGTEAVVGAVVEASKGGDGEKINKKSKGLGAIGKMFGGKNKDKKRSSDASTDDDASEAGLDDEGNATDGVAAKDTAVEEATDDRDGDKKKKSKPRSKSPKRERGKSPKSEKTTSPKVLESEKSEEADVEPETTAVLDSSSDETKENVESFDEGENPKLAKGTKKKKIKANKSSESLKGGVLVEESAELSVEGGESSPKPKRGKLRLSKAAAGDAFDPDASMESLGTDEGGKKKKKKKTKNENHRDGEEVHDDPDSSAGSLEESSEIKKKKKKKKKDDHHEVAPNVGESDTHRVDEHPGEASKKKKKKK
jgi:hypothetical protein